MYRSVIATSLFIILEIAGGPVAAADRHETSASWYNEGSHTANGERFKPRGLTAAHRTLAFGTMVKVTNLANGRSVIVRINDRGPAMWTGRTFDLAQGAASVVHMLKAGVVRIIYEIL